MKILAVVSIVASLIFVAPVTAQFSSGTQGTDAINIGGPLIVGATPTVAPTPVVVNPPAYYDFSAGTVLASAVNWLILAFGGIVVSSAALLTRKGMMLLHIQSNQAINYRIEEALRNGLNWAASEVTRSLDGKFTIEVKNEIVAKAVEYVLEHQKDLIKMAGLDPESGSVVEQLRAKAETIILDPKQPTNPGLVSNPPSKTEG